jgi:hypothetical protein
MKVGERLSPTFILVCPGLKAKQSKVNIMMVISFCRLSATTEMQGMQVQPDHRLTWAPLAVTIRPMSDHVVLLR